MSMKNVVVTFFFCCKQKTAYEMRISYWSSDVCSSDLQDLAGCPVDQRVDIDHPAHRFRHDGDREGAVGGRQPLRRGMTGDVERLAAAQPDLKSGVQGKSVSVRVHLCGRRFITKKQIAQTALQPHLTYSTTLTYL